MDPQSLQSIIGIAQVLLVLIFGLVCLNLYLVFRLKDIDPFAKWNPNKINGTLFFVFLVVGLIAAVVSTGAWSDYYILITNPASAHGIQIDRMFMNTSIVAAFVTIVTNGLLFYFAWRYRSKDKNQKAYYLAHNNKLEYLWTGIPAVVLTILIVDGIFTWNNIMGDPPQDAIEVEINAKQFDWTFRYPGADMDFGATKVAFINEGAGNMLGFDVNDSKGLDDVVTRELHFPVNTDITLNIKSRDVLHSPTLPHFRVKMDAVPGMPTHFTFRPTVTTDSMRIIRNNPEFDYEMSCQQICGGGHWNMRAIVVVETMEEYQAWLREQKTDKPYFAVTAGDKDNSSDIAENENADQSNVKVDGSVSMNQ